MTELTNVNVVLAIFEGKLDPALDKMIDAIRERQRTLARIGLVTIKPGDKVRFKQNVRPHYLCGLVAIVKRVNRGSVVVDVEKNQLYGRFSGKSNIRCPAGIVELVK